MVYNNLNQEILFSFKKRIVISNLFFFFIAKLIFFAQTPNEQIHFRVDQSLNAEKIFKFPIEKIRKKNNFQVKSFYRY